jgi:hypothetical protein
MHLKAGNPSSSTTCGSPADRHCNRLVREYTRALTFRCMHLIYQMMNLLRRVKGHGPALFLFCTVLSFFFVPAWGGTSGRLGAYSKDWAHFPLFAGLAALLLFLWPRRHQSALLKASRVAGSALVLALLVEIIQPLAGRSATVTDWLLGAAGSMAAVAVYLALRSSSWHGRRGLILASAFLLLAATTPILLILVDRLSAWRAFPLLDSFERPVESSRWRPDGCVLERVEEHATHGRYALRMTVPERQDGTLGAYLNDGAMDWRGYRQLTLDVFLESDSARGLLILLDDQLGAPRRERAVMNVELKPGQNRVAMDLPSLAFTVEGRPLTLDHIASMGLYVKSARPGDALYLDQLKLGGRDEAFQR